MILQIIGWIGTGLFIAGGWLIARKNLTGFYLNATANLLYLWQSIYMNNHPLFFLSLLLIYINFEGVYKWQFKELKG